MEFISLLLQVLNVDLKLFENVRTVPKCRFEIVKLFKTVGTVPPPRVLGLSTMEREASIRRVQLPFHNSCCTVVSEEPALATENQKYKISSGPIVVCRPATNSGTSAMGGKL